MAELLFLFLKGMKGVLAPFSYLVSQYLNKYFFRIFETSSLFIISLKPTGMDRLIHVFWS